MIAAAFDDRVFDTIRRTPRIRASEIATVIDADPAAVSASLLRLRRAYRVKKAGTTRASTYTVTNKARR